MSRAGLRDESTPRDPETTDLSRLPGPQENRRDVSGVGCSPWGTGRRLERGGPSECPYVQVRRKGALGVAGKTSDEEPLTPEEPRQGSEFADVTSSPWGFPPGARRRLLSLSGPFCLALPLPPTVPLRQTTERGVEPPARPVPTLPAHADVRAPPLPPTPRLALRSSLRDRSALRNRGDGR